MDDPDFYRAPSSEIDQGDIFSWLPHIHFKDTIKVVRPESGPGGAQRLKQFEVDQASLPDHTTSESPNGGYKFQEGEKVISFCQLARGIVLSHGCEIDKDKKHRLIALVRPLGNLTANDQSTIRERRNFSSFYLPTNNDLDGENYVDFRRITTVAPEFLLVKNRLTSISESAARQLIMQFFLYVARVDPKHIEKLFEGI